MTQQVLNFTAPICQSAPIGLRSATDLVQRTHIVVDLENLCGGSDFVARRAASARKSLGRVFALEASQVVVAVGIHAWTTTPELGFLWPNARFLVGRGIDGADLRLLEDLLDEPQARRSSHVIIASGDGKFADAALTLRGTGVHVTVVARPDSLSPRLSQAASSVTLLAPLGL